MGSFADSYAGRLRPRIGQRLLLNPGAAIVALRDHPQFGEQVLVQRRTDHPGVWEIPSGAAEPGESFELAAARELFEETGLSVAADTLVPFAIKSNTQSRYPNGDLVQGYTIGFEARPHDTVTGVGDGEAHDQQWVGVDELPEPMTPGSQQHLLAWRAFVQTGRVQQAPGDLTAEGEPAGHDFADSYLGQLRRIVGHEQLLVPGALMVVLDPAGRVLVQQRTDNGLWELPGGSAEPGQSFVHCARAELFEETGIELPVGAFEPFATLSGPGCTGTYPNGDQIQSFSVAFVTQLDDDTIPGGRDGEALHARFVDPGDLPQPMSKFGHALTLLRKYRQTGRFQLGDVGLQPWAPDPIA